MDSNPRAGGYYSKFKVLKQLRNEGTAFAFHVAWITT